MAGYTQKERLLAAMELEIDDAETNLELGALIDRVSSLMDGVMGFSFEMEITTFTIEGSGALKLYLPPPGAAKVYSLVESGVTLAPSSYTLDARHGQFLTRMDGYWTAAPGVVTITALPSQPPAGLEEICIEECVRRWQGRAAGYPDVVGVEGSNERRYSRAFAPGTVKSLEQIARDYGVRNLVSI